MTGQAALQSGTTASSPPREWHIIFSALGIFGLALLMRLWLIGYIPFPVFDEVYFPNHATAYLEGKAPWEGHPPLGKYFIMLGIGLWGKNSIGYRITNAVAGALLPVLLMGLTYRLTQRWPAAVLAGLLMLTDGLYLVESRLGLINVYLIGIGLVSQILLLVALERQGHARTFILCLAGLMLGASTAVKWNGLGFALMDFLLIGLVSTVALFRPKQVKHLGLLAQLAKLQWWHYPVCFGLMPTMMYVLVCVPHILQSPDHFAPESLGEVFPTFWTTLLAYHQYMIWWHNTAEVGTQISGSPVHPYCSNFLSWPILGRPIAYYFSANGHLVQSIHALGNPILWWLSTLAILGLSVHTLFRLQPAIVFVLVGYSANYLPWMMVKRCLFLYHYMSAAAFSFMALALVGDWLLQQKGWRYVMVFGLGAIGLSYGYFLPLWLGLPISLEKFYSYMWSEWLPIPGFNWP